MSGRVYGGMAEWLKAAVLKTVRRESVSRVRIPVPPPSHSGKCEQTGQWRGFQLLDGPTERPV